MGKFEEGVAYRIDRNGNAKRVTAEHDGHQVDLPGAIPDETWTHEQLEAYAGAEGIDFGSARSKGDRVALIAEHRVAGQPALPAAD